MATNESVLKTAEPLSREQLLELQMLNHKAGKQAAQVEMIGQRRQALMMELNILPEREKQIQAQRDETVKQLQAAYTKAREQLQVPEGLDINIETGEIFDPKQAPQQ
jgi:hypothetical protein